MVSGLAPGRFALTCMVGKSTCGSGATGSSGKATRPTSRMPPISSEVAIGRRTNGSEMFMARSSSRGYRRLRRAPRNLGLRCRCTGRLRGLDVAGDRMHARPGLQPVLIAGHHALPALQAVEHHHGAVALLPEAAAAAPRRSSPPSPHRRTGPPDRAGPPPCGSVTTPVCWRTSTRTLTNWPGQSVFLVFGKGGLEPHGAGGRIDLIVDQRQRATVELRAVIA